MATKGRQSRRSEPSKPPSAELPRVSVPRQRGGYDFPLSREEKKQRVMYLFQTELADAEKNNAENLDALQKLLEKRTADSSTAVADGEGSIVFSESARSARKWHMELLAALVALGIAWLCQSSVVLTTTDPEVVALHLDVTSLPPNITDRAQGMRHEGHIRLQLSNCPEAAWWFSGALQLLALEGNVSEGYRNRIVGEQGFALICAKQFKEGAQHLEQHLAFVGFDSFDAQSHLLNALGYSYFHLQDFEKASKFFEFSVRAEEFNPVPWNNFAGAKMMQGELEQAEQALWHAAECVKKLPLHQNHHATIVQSNVHVLSERSLGKSQRTPWIEIWNGYEY